jgi:hypothetical protein
MLAILIEGVFEQQEDGTWLCRNPVNGETQNILESLASLEGQRAQFAMHHLPFEPTPPDPTRWVNVSGNGHFSVEGSTIKLSKFDGTAVTADLADFDGCYARIVGANLETIEKMRDIVNQAGAGDMVENLSKQVEGLQAVVDKISPEENN